MLLHIKRRLSPYLVLQHTRSLLSAALDMGVADRGIALTMDVAPDVNVDPMILMLDNSD